MSKRQRWVCVCESDTEGQIKSDMTEMYDLTLNKSLRFPDINKADLFFLETMTLLGETRKTQVKTPLIIKLDYVSWLKWHVMLLVLIVNRHSYCTWPCAEPLCPTNAIL